MCVLSSEHFVEGNWGTIIDEKTGTIEFMMNFVLEGHTYTVSEKHHVFGKSEAEVCKELEKLSDNRLNNHSGIVLFVEKIGNATLRIGDLTKLIDTIHHQKDSYKETVDLFIEDYTSLLDEEGVFEFYQFFPGAENKEIRPQKLKAAAEEAYYDYINHPLKSDEYSINTPNHEWELTISFSPKKIPMHEIAERYFKKELGYGDIKALADAGKITPSSYSDFSKALRINTDRRGKAEYLFILALYYQWSVQDAVFNFHACADIGGGEINSYGLAGETLLKCLQQKIYQYTKFVQAHCRTLFEFGLPLESVFNNNYYWIVMFNLIADEYHPKMLSRHVLEIKQEADQKELFAESEQINIVFSHIESLLQHIVDNNYPDYVRSLLINIRKAIFNLRNIVGRSNAGKSSMVEEVTIIQKQIKTMSDGIISFLAAPTEDTDEELYRTVLTEWGWPDAFGD